MEDEPVASELQISDERVNIIVRLRLTLTEVVDIIHITIQYLPHELWENFGSEFDEDFPLETRNH